jgi:hypothetical protein
MLPAGGKSRVRLRLSETDLRRRVTRGLMPTNWISSCDLSRRELGATLVICGRVRTGAAGSGARSLIMRACVHRVFSRSSVSRETSYQNEELLLAIEQLRMCQPDDPWLIPVRFDDCMIPDRDIGGGRTLASIQEPIYSATPGGRGQHGRRHRQ